METDFWIAALGLAVLFAAQSGFIYWITSRASGVEAHKSALEQVIKHSELSGQHFLAFLAKTEAERTEAMQTTLDLARGAYASLQGDNHRGKEITAQAGSAARPAEALVGSDRIEG